MLKWRLGGGKKSQDRRYATCGVFEVLVDHDEDGGWLYLIEAGVCAVHEFGDKGYMRGFDSREAAERAAESWLRKQANAMLRDCGRGK